jgi:hypothetical protein
VSPLTGDFAGLHRLVAKLHQASRGELMQAIRKEVAAELERLAARAWAERRTPDGKPWTGTHGQALTLEQTGAMRRSLKVTILPDGIVITVGPGARTIPGRHTITSNQQFGGLTVSGFRKTSRGGAKARWLATNRGSHKGLMRFRVNGRWVSTYATRHTGNRMLPDQGQLPEAWATALQAAAERAVQRWYRR